MERSIGLDEGHGTFVVNLAPTGMIPTKEMTPHVPITPAEVAMDVAKCASIGLTTVHVHARDEDGRPTSDRDTYGRFVEAVREAVPDVAVCVSCSGRNDPTYETRSKVLDLEGARRPDLASLTLASLNFPKSASVNAPDTVIRLAEKMKDRGIKPELEVFDLGMMNYARYLIDKGVLERPFYFNIILGNVASAQPDLVHLGALLHDLPEHSYFSVGGVGDAQLRSNVHGLAQGGGVRVGIEDNVWLDEARSRLCTNIDQVSRINELGKLMGRRAMPPAEFKRLLELS
jgi:uncharacterized protein (DUF849 family)